MAIKKVQSSMVWAVDYDAKAQVLEVALKRTGVFRYWGVPPAAYRAMMKSDSIGFDLMVLHHRHVCGDWRRLSMEGSLRTSHSSCREKHVEGSVR